MLRGALGRTNCAAVLASSVMEDGSLGWLEKERYVCVWWLVEGLSGWVSDGRTYAALNIHLHLVMGQSW